MKSNKNCEMNTISAGIFLENSGCLRFCLASIRFGKGFSKGGEWNTSTSLSEFNREVLFCPEQLLSLRFVLSDKERFYTVTHVW